MGLFGPPNIEKLTQKRDIGALGRALGDRDPAVRMASADALEKFADPESAEALLAALGDEEPRVRMRVARALDSIAFHDRTRLANPRAVELLIAALGDTEWNVRSHAVTALGRIGDGRAFEPLLSRLADSEEFVRNSAVRALGELGDARAARPILELFQQELDRAKQVEGARDFRFVTTFAAAFDHLGPSALPDEARAIAAVWSERWNEVAELGPVAVDQLLLMLSQAGFRHGWGRDDRQVFVTSGERAGAAGRGVRIDATSVIRTLGEIGDPRSVQPIYDFPRGGLTLAADDAAASEALRRIPGLPAFEVLVDGFLGLRLDFNTECKEYRSAIVSRAREAGASGDVDVLPRLVFLLGYEGGAGSPHSDGAITELGKDARLAFGPAAAGAVQALLESKDPGMRERASELLTALDRLPSAQTSM